MLLVSTLLVGWPWRGGAGSASLHSQDCLAVKIKGNNPLGVRFERLFWLRTSH